jgi:polyferredoxin
MKIRRIIQIAVILIVAIIAVNHSLEEAGNNIPWLSTASLHSICPFGGVVSIYQFVTLGTFVQKIHESSFVLMFIVFGTAVLFGPVFCGWICPMGSVQEFLGKLGKKLFKKKFNRFIPRKYDRWLRYLRYLMLAWVLYMTAFSGVLMFQNIDPYYALFNFWTGEVAITGLIVLAVVLVLSIFVERPFCKYACPYGALLGLTNFIRVFTYKRNKTNCIDCKACDKACPMNIEVSKSSSVRNHQCISCNQCSSEEACPIPATVELRSFVKTGKGV